MGHISNNAGFICDKDLFTFLRVRGEEDGYINYVPYGFNPYSFNSTEGGVFFSQTSADFVGHFCIYSCYKLGDLYF